MRRTTASIAPSRRACVSDRWRTRRCAIAACCSISIARSLEITGLADPKIKAQFADLDSVPMPMFRGLQERAPQKRGQVQGNPFGGDGADQRIGKRLRLRQKRGRSLYHLSPAPCRKQRTAVAETRFECGSGAGGRGSEAAGSVWPVGQRGACPRSAADANGIQCRCAPPSSGSSLQMKQRIGQGDQVRRHQA
jgi:hypothetical protein